LNQTLQYVIVFSTVTFTNIVRCDNSFAKNASVKIQNKLMNFHLEHRNKTGLTEYNKTGATYPSSF